MPLTADMLKQNPNPCFIETGTYRGDAVATALGLGFGRVITVEWCPQWAKEAADRYKDDKRVQVIGGDSADALARILPDLTSPCTFWLDAHPLITPMPFFSVVFPLLRELLTIKRFLKGDGHVILIDDLRTFNEFDHKALMHAMRELWPDAAHSFCADRIVKDDVYCCKLTPCG